MKKLLTLFICLLFGLGIMTSCRGKSPTKMVKEAEKLIEGSSKSASKTLPAREFKTPSGVDDAVRYIVDDDDDDDYSYTEDYGDYDEISDDIFYVDEYGTIFYVDEDGLIYYVDDDGIIQYVDVGDEY